MTGGYVGIKTFYNHKKYIETMNSMRINDPVLKMHTFNEDTMFVHINEKEEYKCFMLKMIVRKVVNSDILDGEEEIYSKLGIDLKNEDLTPKTNDTLSLIFPTYHQNNRINIYPDRKLILIGKLYEKFFPGDSFYNAIGKGVFYTLIPGPAISELFDRNTQKKYISAASDAQFNNVFDLFKQNGTCYQQSLAIVSILHSYGIKAGIVGLLSPFDTEGHVVVFIPDENIIIDPTTALTGNTVYHGFDKYFNDVGLPISKPQIYMINSVSSYDDEYYELADIKHSKKIIKKLEKIGALAKYVSIFNLED